MAETPDEVEDVFLNFLGDDPKSPRQIRTQMTKQIAKDKKSAKAWTARAWAHYELDDFDDAVADATQAIALCPQSYLPWYVRGASYFCTGQTDEAEADLSEAIRLADSVKLFLEDAYRYRGGIRCDDNRTEEAIKDLNKCLKIRPDDSQAFGFRGIAYCRKQNYRKAIQDFEKAISLADDYPFPLSALAWLLATCPDKKICDGARALELAELANDLSGNEHLEDLAAAYAEVGDFKNAVKTQKRAIKQCQDPQEKAKFEKRLKLFESGQPHHALWGE
ncbi:cellulose synthase subunit BcsC [Gimesia alba]|uniref:Cellulose synthase subunit BcsC n=1 Tax=Gimesia alba TaxID=2527973 RepID=A0A517RA30_9PLAN|nr:tetratricopeptide repeat protein [Gimesia alba]QDT40711.1 cellulose synthase subunit BcsC [Gimesia alba]